MFNVDIVKSVDNYFKRNPIYYLDAIRYHRQKIAADRNEDSLTSERWMQFWGVVITIAVIPFGVYIARNQYMQHDNVLWFQVFGLILIESVFLCSLMIAIVWEGFNSFKRDMDTGVFETVITTLIEPKKIVWGKFMHVFVHFLKFALTGFLVVFIISPFANIDPALVFVLFALNLAVGCYIISHRIYCSAREAFDKARRRYSKENGISDEKTKGKSESKTPLPFSKKIGGWIEAISLYVILGFVFIQVQLILITNYFGDMTYFPRMIERIIGSYPLAFVVYLFIPVVFMLLGVSAYFHAMTERILKEII